MTAKKVMLIKYGEISLRKGNRAHYERQLIGLIRQRLQEVGGKAIHVLREQGRILVEDTRGDIDFDTVLSKVRPLFGITAFCLCVKTAVGTPEELMEECLSFIRKNWLNRETTFKVETKRGDKRYPLTSQEVSAKIGAHLLAHEPGLTVEVRRPALTLWVEIRTHIYIYTDSIRGEGGLPYGASGKGTLLLSGGIDSPVAGYLTARRGVDIMPVYFHSPPYTSERALDKVLDITRLLSRYTGQGKLMVVPFTEVQLYLHAHVKPEKLTILLKRAMLKIASQLAAIEGSHCLITGDSIGQVASQTIHALESVHTAASLPVLRPLAAMDKQQIIDLAIAIGSYEISIRPYDDCCTLFVAEHPDCKPKASVIDHIESRLMELSDLCQSAVAQTKVYEI